MADTATIGASLNVKIAGTDLSYALNKSALARNLATIAEATTGLDTMGAGFKALSFGAVGDNEITILALENLSTTTGEDVTIGKRAIPQTTGGSYLVWDATQYQDGGSVPATLTGSGYFRVINVAGTSQGIVWDVGDIAIYLGTSGHWGRIPVVEFWILRGNDVLDFNISPIKADGNPTYAKASTGTPRLANLAVGALG